MTLYDCSAYSGPQSLDHEVPSTVNDPHVVALHYTVEHGNSVRYQNACPLSLETPEFHLTLEDNNVRFVLKEQYADEDEARKALEPFVRCWEFVAGLRSGPGQFKLRYERAEIVDQNPSPPTSPSTLSIWNLRGNIRIPAPTLSARITYESPRYPAPPSECIINPDDPDVATMYHRYERYRLGREPLPGMAYFCYTMLTDVLCGSRKEASPKYRISGKVLCKVSKLSSYKGGSDARKADAVSNELTELEKRFLDQAIVEIIFRVAQVAADENQCLPKITLSDLPSLTK